MTRLTTLLVIALLSTTGCKKKPAPAPAPGSASGSAGSNAMAGSAEGSGSAPAGSDTPVANGSGSGAAAGSGAAGSGSAAPAQRGVGAIVEGTSCDGHGEQITKAGDTKFTLTGKQLAGQHMHGCGCPTKPVHTLVYKPATSPLEVRVCFDQKADMCEMACRDVKFDLGAALDGAKATAIKFVD